MKPTPAQQNVNYGKGVVSLDFSEYGAVEPEEVLQRLLEVFRSPDYNPPRLPGCALQLLELTRRADVAAEQVSTLLVEDQLLAAEVLKLAQSSLYNPSGAAVHSIGDAVVRLGLRRTSDLFLQVSMQMRVFKVKAYQATMNQLKNHSILVAHLARHISRQTSLFDEHAFLCGLLHDAGIAASLIALSDSAPRGTPPPDFSQVWDAVRRAHTDAGATLAQVWQLPQEVGFVMQHHHAFSVAGYPHPTSAVIALCDALVEKIGCGFFDETEPDVIERAYRALGLRPDDLPKFLKKGEQLARELL